MDAITQFKGDFRFLSNFYDQEIEFRGKTWPTSEHAYQAMKSLDEEDQEFVRNQSTPGKAKRAGKKVTLREDWEEVKIDVMREVLEAKFSVPEMKERLLLTGEAKLVEGNYWGDTFWGKCKGEGMNILGKLLMEIRDRLRQSDQS